MVRGFLYIECAHLFLRRYYCLTELPIRAVEKWLWGFQFSDWADQSAIGRTQQLIFPHCHQLVSWLVMMRLSRRRDSSTFNICNFSVNSVITINFGWRRSKNYLKVTADVAIEGVAKIMMNCRTMGNNDDDFVREGLIGCKLIIRQSLLGIAVVVYRGNLGNGESQISSSH